MRLRQNSIGGKVEDNPLTSGATTLTSSALSAVIAVAGPDTMALVLDPDGIVGAPEIVYVTAHTLTAGTATIIRGQEGTTARAHNQDEDWVHGPTTYDYTGVVGSWALGTPTGTASVFATTVMMGLGATATLTPSSSGRLLVAASFTIGNSVAGDGGCARLRYGTATAPANGAAATGTLAANSAYLPNIVSGARVGGSINFIATGLTIGTAYWFDLDLGAIGGGTTTTYDVGISVAEV